jgi:hypothetical protein
LKIVYPLLPITLSVCCLYCCAIWLSNSPHSPLTYFTLPTFYLLPLSLFFYIPFAPILFILSHLHARIVLFTTCDTLVCLCSYFFFPLLIKNPLIQSIHPWLHDMTILGTYLYHYTDTPFSRTLVKDLHAHPATSLVNNMFATALLCTTGSKIKIILQSFYRLHVSMCTGLFTQ